MHADTRLAVAVGRPLPGNRNDCSAFAESGVDTATGHAAVIADGVAEALAACQKFLSARQLHALMLADGVHVGLSTVYRALHERTRLGRVDLVRDETGERLYRYRTAHDRRHYLLCRRRGHSRALAADLVKRWADGLSARTGFAEVRHTLKITGICATCASDDAGHTAPNHSRRPPNW